MPTFSPRQPFRVDSSDPHRTRGRADAEPAHYDSSLGVRDKESRSPWIFEENVWGNAINRVAADGISPEQAVDEAIARIKEILSE